ncbi:MAG: hypothetical protein D6736_04090 [Nitrospinota bacterium]|nr:MAG: hypothetical protein D6736_04090 [Nitrospinota bacterium]
MPSNMTPEEIRAYLEQEKVCALATVDAQQRPHLAAVWYVFLDDDLYIRTSLNSQKIKNLRQNPALSLLVCSRHRNSYQDVVIWGKAEFVNDPALDRRFSEALGLKYYGAVDHPEAIYYSTLPDRVLLRIQVEKIRGWDYSKE